MISGDYNMTCFVRRETGSLRQTEILKNHPKYIFKAEKQLRENSVSLI